MNARPGCQKNRLSPVEFSNLPITKAHRYPSSTVKKNGGKYTQSNDISDGNLVGIGKATLAEQETGTSYSFYPAFHVQRQLGQIGEKT